MGAERGVGGVAKQIDDGTKSVYEETRMSDEEITF